MRDENNDELHWFPISILVCAPHPEFLLQIKEYLMTRVFISGQTAVFTHSHNKCLTSSMRSSLMMCFVQNSWSVCKCTFSFLTSGNAALIGQVLKRLLFGILAANPGWRCSHCRQSRKQQNFGSGSLQRRMGSNGTGDLPVPKFIVIICIITVY